MDDTPEDIFSLYDPSFENQVLPDSEIDKKPFLEKDFGLSIDDTKRNIKRAYTRGGEALAGLAGDSIQALQLLQPSEEKKQSVVEGKYPELSGLLEEKGISSDIAKTVKNLIPDSDDLRARSAELHPELEPKNALEEFQDDISADFATLLLPEKGKIPFAKALGMSAVGNFGAAALKELGFSEDTQNYTKMGLFLFTGLFGKGRGVKTYISDSYKDAESFVGKGESFRYDQKGLNNVNSILSKGELNPQKLKARGTLEQMLEKSANGSMTVENMVEFDKDLSKRIFNSNDKSERGYFKMLKKENLKIMDGYATENPSWGHYHNQAKQAHAGIESSLKLQSFIRKNANLKNFTYASAVLGLEKLAFPGQLIPKLAAAGAGGATLYAAELGKRFATNPALRRYYLNVMKASLNNNKGSLMRNLKGLERAAEKEFKDNPMDIDEAQEEPEDYLDEFLK